MNSLLIREYAKLYSEGQKIPIDRKELLKYLMEISNSEDIYVKRALGLMYLKGDCVAKNYLQAYMWFNEAALQDDATSQYYLGHLYENGYGIYQNDKIALKWYLKAAQKNNRQALNSLGCYYLKSEEYSSALEWYKKAMELHDAEAAFSIACCHLVGKGVVTDENQAYEWFFKAAENGCEIAKELVQFTPELKGTKKGVYYYEIAKRIEEDYYTESSRMNAIAFYEKAAEYGNVEAQYELGIRYLNGSDEIEKNYSKAFALLSPVAKKGNMYAQNSLGYMYAYGYGVTRSDKKAHIWFKRAAKQGNAEAMNNLAMTYEDGIGVSPNKKRALKWYESANRNGYDKNSNNIKNLNNEMNAIRCKNKSLRTFGSINIFVSLLVGLGIFIWFGIAAGDKSPRYVNSVGIIYLCGVVIPYIIYLIYGARVSIKELRNMRIMTFTYCVEIVMFAIFYMLIRKNIISIGNCDGVFNHSALVVFGTFLFGMIIVNYGNWVCAKKVHNPMGLVGLSIIAMFLYSILVYTILFETIVNMLAVAVMVLLIVGIIYAIGWYYLLR